MEDIRPESPMPAPPRRAVLPRYRQTGYDRGLEPAHDGGLTYWRDAQAALDAERAEVAEMTRRRDEWRRKAEGYDAVRKALREKVGAPWPPNLSRALWAGLAADEKKRADDAEAEVERLAGGAAEAWRAAAVLAESGTPLDALARIARANAAALEGKP
jgi:hypothetical protein